MSAFRSRARLIALAWLLCQVASLSAFVPEDCCPAHHALAAEKAKASPDCHETAAAPAPEPESGDACPMHRDDGAACPMHRSPSTDCCRMSAGCEGPNQPLARLFSFIGVIDTPVASMTAPPPAPAAFDRSVPLLSRLARPDAPPPKA